MHPLFLIIAPGKKFTVKAKNEVSNDFSLMNLSPGMSYKGKICCLEEERKQGLFMFICLVAHLHPYLLCHRRTIQQHIYTFSNFVQMHERTLYSRSNKISMQADSCFCLGKAEQEGFLNISWVTGQQ